MIHFVSQQQLDKQKWDQLVSADINGHSFLFSNYLDTVSPHWGVICDEALTAGVVVFEKKILGKRIVILPNFTQAIPLIGDKQLKTTIEEQLLHFLNEAHMVSYAYAGSLSDDRTLQFTEMCHQLIRYDSGQRFPTKVWGRNIRKAESNHLIHVEDMPIDVFVAALELELNQKGNPYSKKDYTRLSKIIMMTKAAGIGFLKGIKNNQGSFICGQFYVYNNHQLYLVACFSDAEAKLHSALHYLMYTLVKNNFSHQLVVHFGGSNIPVIADFNKNFGAVDERYVKVVKKNILFTLLNKLI